MNCGNGMERRKETVALCSRVLFAKKGTLSTPRTTVGRGSYPEHNPLSASEVFVHRAEFVHEENTETEA